MSKRTKTEKKQIQKEQTEGIYQEIKIYDFDCGLYTGNIENFINETQYGYMTGATNIYKPYMHIIQQTPQFYACGQPYADRTGTFCINQITQGSEYFQRIGRKIMMKDVSMKLEMFTFNNNEQWIEVYNPNTWQSGVIRFLIVYDKQPELVVQSDLSTTIAPVLEATDLFNISPDGITSWDWITDGAGNAYAGDTTVTWNLGRIHPANEKRFQILHDEYATLNAMKGGGKTVEMINRFINLEGLETIYGNGDPAYPNGYDIKTGSLHFLIASDQGNYNMRTDNDTGEGMLSFNDLPKFCFNATFRIRYYNA